MQRVKMGPTFRLARHRKRPQPLPRPGNYGGSHWIDGCFRLEDIMPVPPENEPSLLEYVLQPPRR